MEKWMPAFLFLCIILFVGEVFFKEAFADCTSPGAMTWTITMNPGDAGTCGTSVGSGASTSKKEYTDASGSDYWNGYTEADAYVIPRPRDYDLGKIYDVSDNAIYRDASGVRLDGSGNPINTDYNFNLSLSDLLSLVGAAVVRSDSRPQYVLPNYISYEQRQPIPRQYAPKGYYPPDVGELLDEQYNYIRTPATIQGNDYIKYTNAMNPNDYIRKDSIPCYACSL
jgi:hypothetical protein